MLKMRGKGRGGRGRQIVRGKEGKVEGREEGGEGREGLEW